MGSYGGTSEFADPAAYNGSDVIRYISYGGAPGGSVGNGGGTSTPYNDKFNTRQITGSGGGGGRSGEGGVGTYNGGNGRGAINYWSGGGGGGGSAGYGQAGEAGLTYPGYPNGGDGGTGFDLAAYLDPDMPSSGQIIIKNINGAYRVGKGGGGGSGGGGGAVSQQAQAGGGADQYADISGNGGSNYQNLPAISGRQNSGSGGGGGYGGASELGRGASPGSIGGSGLVVIKYDKFYEDWYNVNAIGGYKYIRSTYVIIYFLGSGSLEITEK